MMAELAVMIDGRVYRVACDEGEEARLGDLAQLVDAKISALRQRFGEIGDQRLVIMAAIALADEWAEANTRARELEAELVRLKTPLTPASDWAEQGAASGSGAGQGDEHLGQDPKHSNGE